MEHKKRIAVVGSGISGLSAAWLLTKCETTHMTVSPDLFLFRNGYSVTLYEKETTLGGHTMTHTSGDVPVDLGFQV